MKGFFLSWPKRVLRLIIQILLPGRYIYYHIIGEPPWQYLQKQLLLTWFFGVLVLLLDIFGIPEILETLADLIKWRTRPLTTHEQKMGEKIFGSQIDWKRVRLDTRAIAGPKQLRIAYVGFYTINSWGALPSSVLIHEMTHIWQFEQIGSLYIPLALQAQLSDSGYDYGGVEKLKQSQEWSFHCGFNVEQQAEIVQDFYRSKNKMSLQWSREGAAADYWLSYWVRKGIQNLGAHPIPLS